MDIIFGNKTDRLFLVPSSLLVNRNVSIFKLGCCILKLLWKMDCIVLVTKICVLAAKGYDQHLKIGIARLSVPKLIEFMPLPAAKVSVPCKQVPLISSSTTA